MKKTIISSLAAAALLIFAGAATAEEITGTVERIDAEAQTLTLENGMTFSLSEDVDIEGLSAGQEVKVTYEKQDSVNIATEVERPEN